MIAAFPLGLKRNNDNSHLAPQIPKRPQMTSSASQMAVTMTRKQQPVDSLPSSPGWREVGVKFCEDGVKLQHGVPDSDETHESRLHETRLWSRISNIIRYKRSQHGYIPSPYCSAGTRCIRVTTSIEMGSQVEVRGREIRGSTGRVHGVEQTGYHPLSRTSRITTTDSRDRSGNRIIGETSTGHVKLK